MGYKLLDTKYLGCRHPMMVECPVHGAFKTTWSNINSGHGCKKCGSERRAQATRHSYQWAKEVIEGNGCALVSKEFHSIHEKLEIFCPVHGVFRQSLVQNERSKGCPRCSRDKGCKSKSLGYDKAKIIVESAGYEFPYQQYHNNRTKMDMICKKHGVFHMTINDINRGRHCPVCSREQASLKMSREGSPLWKGGASPLEKQLRESLSKWTANQLREKDYKCEITGKTGNLNVHHMTSFSSILEKTLNDVGAPREKQVRDYSVEEIDEIQSAFIKNNDKMANPVVMLEEVHKKFHQFCGGYSKPTSFKQLEEFKKAIATGAVVIDAA